MTATQLAYLLRNKSLQIDPTNGDERLDRIEAKLDAIAEFLIEMADIPTQSENEESV